MEIMGRMDVYRRADILSAAFDKLSCYLTGTGWVAREHPDHFLLYAERVVDGVTTPPRWRDSSRELVDRVLSDIALLEAEEEWKGGD